MNQSRFGVGLGMFPLILAGVAFALSFAIPDRALRFGPAVVARFLERGDTIPPDGTPLSATSLELWLEQNASAAKGYVRVVLPLDVGFLLCFGTFLAAGSHELAKGTGFPGWLFYALPVGYMVADLTEDYLIATVLSRSPRDVSKTFDRMRAATKVKLLLAVASSAQFFIAALYAVYFWLKTN